MPPKILVISFSPLRQDARVLRQIHLLSELGEVSSVGYGPAPSGVAQHFEIPTALKSLPESIFGAVRLSLRRHRRSEVSAPAHRHVLREVPDSGWNLVVANDARALDVAHALRGTAPMWADMHEWAPTEQSQLLLWRWLVAPFMRHLCRRYLPTADLVTSVSPGICELYQAEFGVPAQLLPNAGSWQDLSVQPVGSKLRLVHSGAAIAGRGLDTLISAAVQLSATVTLDLYLVPGGDNGNHLRYLKQLASGATHIQFHEPVPPGDLPATLNKYDVGVFVIPPQQTNARLTLPNKFFDFVQARLCLVIGPSPEMVRLVQAHGLGEVTADFSTAALVDTLTKLTPAQVSTYKEHSHQAAAELNFAHYARPITETLRGLL